MRMVPPEVRARKVCVARNQPEYKVLTVALVVDPQVGDLPDTEHNAVLMAFRPTDAERARLAAGEDIYISLLTFGGSQQPIIVWAGKDEPARHFSVEVE